eukprot:TRINITY_DN74501_c0_g1_i1.p1 TRINITY_DN74501_c0_g1~~TRINITY_DN74501_c0_g1_i1.p1  ORF type:complete len:681 (-),score=120.44 TRINITY_DN74501_c0_g1_i1:62-2104(-)
MVNAERRLAARARLAALEEARKAEKEKKQTSFAEAGSRTGAHSNPTEGARTLLTDEASEPPTVGSTDEILVTRGKTKRTDFLAGTRLASTLATDQPTAKRRKRRHELMGKNKTAIVPLDTPKAMGTTTYRDSHNIIIKSADCPDPFETFEMAKAHIGDSFVQLLRDRGFFAPSPIQAQTWPVALAGRDVVGIAQTGSGKTLAYLLPPLVRLRDLGKPSSAADIAMPRVLVLAPTRELTTQIASEAAKLVIPIGHRFVPCFGGVWKGSQLKQLAKGCDILLSTPGRLKDFLLGDSKKGRLPAVDVQRVSYLVLDEADAMLAMGFMPQIREIIGRCMKIGTADQGGGAKGPCAWSARQTLLFTATWPRKVQLAAKEFTSSDAVQLRIGQGVGVDKLTANENVRQIVQVVEYWDKSTRLLNTLTSELKDGETCIVFCGTRGRAEHVVRELRRCPAIDWCEAIHSGKEQHARDASLVKFRQHTANGDQRAVLVSTDVAARGIDIPGVALVVVYDLNGWHGELSIDSYVHRIGRTGRAGTIGRAYTFVESRDRGIPQLCKLLEDAGQRVPQPVRDLEVAERLPIDATKGKGKGHGKVKGTDVEEEIDEEDDGGKVTRKKKNSDEKRYFGSAYAETCKRRELKKESKGNTESKDNSEGQGSSSLKKKSGAKHLVSKKSRASRNVTC